MQCKYSVNISILYIKSLKGNIKENSFSWIQILSTKFIKYVNELYKKALNFKNMYMYLLNLFKCKIRFIDKC